MSSEIIPLEEGNASSSTTETRHSSQSQVHVVRPWDLLDPRTAFNSKVSIDLIGGDYHTQQYLASEKGHKYVKLLNPTLESVKPLLASMKEPSVLLLRGCDMLLQSPGFSFDKFKTLTTLEISRCPHLTTLPKNTISQMTQLQSLDLSYLPIYQLPSDLFLNATDTLRSLVIRGCSNIYVLPEPSQPLNMLEYLDLSHLPIQTLPRDFISNMLHTIILRGCSKLHSLSVFRSYDLRFLDLSHCFSLTTQNVSIFQVKIIDLSYTACGWDTVPLRVSHMFIRNANLCNPKGFRSFNSTKVCDLSGNQGLGDVSMLKNCSDLEALNLSQTRIESIDFLSKLTSLRTLVLRECTMLKHLPTIEQLECLELFDLSGCEILCDLPEGLSTRRQMKELNLSGCKGFTELREGLFDDMLCLEILDLSNTNIKNLPSFANLTNRGTVINHSSDSILERFSSFASEVQESSTVAPELSNLRNLCSDNADSLHLVTTFMSKSGFDKFRYRFTELNRYLLFLEEKINRTVVDTKASGIKMQFLSMHADLEYILGKLDLLESSQNSRSCELLLHQLMSYDCDNYDDDDSSILKKLLRTVTKLKLLVLPPPPPNPPTEPYEDLSPPLVPFRAAKRREAELADKYNSLTPIQRNCLLYFACLSKPSTTRFITGTMIKGSILIHLWYGEGFFDQLLHANSTSNLIPKMSCDNPHRNDANQQASCSSTIEEIGRGILHVLERKEFIWIEEEEKDWRIRDIDFSFAITKAMEEHLFDFNNRGKLTPHSIVSGRACFLKSDIDHPPSSQVWLNYTRSSELLERFKTVRTLMYIDEPIVDINTEWFSSMTNLHVLHLANLYSEQQVRIVDLKFLDELKRMKQLRLLNLKSFAAIQKLPDSICQLTNLRILNLSYCSNLMDLPTGIDSLSNLIILDLTQCHLLPELPKGLASLTKLEVLKGFPITYTVSGTQSKKACTLRELMMLGSLRKLNIVVNRDSFPDTRDLKVLRSMKELRNLKITWTKNIYKEEELSDAVEKGALRQSRWNRLKCWGPHIETEEVDDELLLTNSSLGDLNKLVLCCFPFETEPDWLHPTELQNLEKLYIVGGSLRTLFQDFTDQTTWNIMSVKLKYLSNLHMDWRMTKGSFPCFTSCDDCGCPHLTNFNVYDSLEIIEDSEGNIYYC